MTYPGPDGSARVSERRPWLAERPELPAERCQRLVHTQLDLVLATQGNGARPPGDGTPRVTLTAKGVRHGYRVRV